DFPEDHLHHRGIFWTWHQLFIDTTQVADPWLCSGIKWEIDSIERLVSAKKAILKIRINWEVNYNNMPYQIIREETEITYFPTENGYKLLFRIELNPLGNNIKLGGSDDEKGYGGFSFRMKLNDSTSFHTNDGSIEPKNLAMELGNWVEVQNIENHNIKVENLSDSKIPFKGWILRKKKSMQNAAIPGRKLLDLEKGNPLVLEHSLEVSL
nr:PmoA family protein [Flammeovirgaceae bacterium]